MTITDTFVETLYTLHKRPLTEELRNEARRCMLDEAACILAGIPIQEEMLNKYLDFFTGEDASVFGLNRKASLQNAALANAIIGHACDLDDGHRFSTVHLASTTIPAVLAVAEKEDLEMEDVLRGIVIGYETSIRLGRCVQPAHRARGFHSSGTVGTVGAAMGVASALDMDKEGFKAALAAALTSAAGLNEMMENVSTMKPYNVGRAAHDGITAAYIARSGFVGPNDPMWGKFGFLHSACESFDERVLSLEFDDGYNITGGYHKPYAACRHVHPAVFAALMAAERCAAPVDEIEKIEVSMYGQGIKGHDHTEILGPVAGKMSAPFCIALALKTGDVGVRSFTEKNIGDRDILELAKKVSVTENPKFTAEVPKKRAAEVIVTAKNGRVGSYRADYAPGEPEIPMTTEEMANKLRSNSGKSREENERLIDAILHHNGKASVLISLLA